MFKNFKVVNIFNMFSKENRERNIKKTHDKDAYISIASSMTILGVLAVPAMFLNGSLESVIKSSTIYIAGGVVFCLMYFVFKK